MEQLTKLDTSMHEMLCSLFWVGIFSAFDAPRMHECAVFLFLSQLFVAASACSARMLTSAVKTAVSEPAPTSEVDGNGSESSDGADDESSDKADDESSDGSNDEISADKSQDDGYDKGLVESAEKVLDASVDDVEAATTTLFYRMFVLGVTEFVYDDHVFTLDKQVRVKKQ